MAAVLFSVPLAEANQSCNNKSNSNICVCVYTDVCTVKSLNMCFPLIELILKSTFHSILTMINNNNPTHSKCDKMTKELLIWGFILISLFKMLHSRAELDWSFTA